MPRKGPKPDEYTVCRYCSKKFCDTDKFIYAKVRSGKTVFVHLACYNKEHKTEVKL